MPSLPFEILRHIFNCLEKKDLLNCQLTSKEWNEASAELLYSDVLVKTNDVSFKFVRAISNSPRLGRYLKKIRIYTLFKKPEMGTIWDEHNLLTALVQNCPNLSEIDGKLPDLTFWTRILYFVTKGRLSRLQLLPESDTKNLESYICTALCFKPTLASLTINDIQTSFGPDLNKLAVYQELLDEISEFTNLKTISIKYQSNNPLSYFDTLIEDCQQLKKFQINLYSSEVESAMIEPRTIINSRPDIHEFHCNWEIIDRESQLRYFMQKFTNLKSLVISRFLTVSKPCPTNTVIDFLHYVLEIPFFTVTLPLKMEDLTMAWTALIDMNDSYRDIAIEYGSDGDRQRKVSFWIRRTGTLNICFSYYLNYELLGENEFIEDEEEDALELPHIDFFLKVGSMVRSLILPDYLSQFGMDCISRILQSCTSLEELTLQLSIAIFPSSDIDFTCTELKKLSIVLGDDNVDTLPSFFSFISSKLPNIKHIQFDYINSSDCYIQVDMPCSRLDTITSVNLMENYNIGVAFEAYIRLNADGLEKFYIGNRYGLLETNEDSYDQSEPFFCLNITCKSLKQIVVRSVRPPYKEIKWIF